MADFTISRVSSKPPRQWSFKDRRTGEAVDMETYKVMLEGEDEPVELNRKPGNKPSLGEVLTGTLDYSEFGRRFKPEKKPFGQGRSPRDSQEIRAMWAIGQAVAFVSKDGAGLITDVEPTAKDFFNMVERVKTGELSGYAKAKEAVDNIGIVKEVLPGATEFDQDKINLDDIPF